MAISNDRPVTAALATSTAAPTTTPSAPAPEDLPECEPDKGWCAPGTRDRLQERRELLANESHSRGISNDPDGVYQPRPGEKQLLHHNNACCSGMKPGFDKPYSWGTSSFLRGASKLELPSSFKPSGGVGHTKHYDVAPLDLPTVANGHSPAELIEVAKAFNKLGTAISGPDGYQMTVPENPELYGTNEQPTVPPQFAAMVSELLASLNEPDGFQRSRLNKENKYPPDPKLRLTKDLVALLKSNTIKY